MKTALTLIVALFAFSSAHAAGRDVDCKSNKLANDGDLNEVRFVEKENGTFDIFYSHQTGGLTSGKRPSPVADLLVGSLVCDSSKLDPRVKGCYNSSTGEQAASGLDSQSQLKYAPNGEISHIMVDSIVISVATPKLSVSKLSFSSNDCSVH